MVAVFVWVLVGIALWHFTVFVPDRFVGGIIGAFLAAIVGACATGWLLPAPGFTGANPPGVVEALWALPGTVLGLWLCWAWGDRRLKLSGDGGAASARASRPPAPQRRTG
jgi:uncharacterized membrane protein YeaQ/YmgE (transglycosylase-associated protein family)